MSESLATAWQGALAAEHAAIFGYGVLGPHLAAPGQITLARHCESQHEAQRDRAVAGLLASGLTPVAPRADYPLPFPVLTADAARRLALRLEEAAASTWRYLIAVAVDPTTTPGVIAVTPLRADAQRALSAGAVRAVQWRQLVTPAAPTVPFPGIP